MTPTPQPKALELADYLDWGVTDRRTRQSSAAELRRQHAEIERLKEECRVLRARLALSDAIYDAMENDE